VTSGYVAFKCSFNIYYSIVLVYQLGGGKHLTLYLDEIDNDIHQIQYIIRVVLTWHWKCTKFQVFYWIYLGCIHIHVEGIYGWKFWKHYALFWCSI